MFTEQDILAEMAKLHTASAASEFARLYAIVRLLYGPGGCPWDREQTPSTMREHLVEECYEVLDAVDTNSPASINEEIGDSMLVLTMIAHIYEETRKDEAVSPAAALRGVSEKLVRRHPHVFRHSNTEEGLTSMSDGGTGGAPAAPATTSSAVLTQWEQIKHDERTAKGSTSPTAGTGSVLDGITKGLAPLDRAAKLQKRAAKLGFDWQNTDPVLEKLQEELHELDAALKSKNQDAVEDELGDILFTVVNLARKLNIHPTTALHRSNRKFEARFRHLEQLVYTEAVSSAATTPRPMLGTDDATMTLEQLDRYWELTKQHERNRNSS